MKKFSIIALPFCLITFWGCNLDLKDGILQTISIKSNATYNYSIGEFSYDELSKNFQPDSLIPTDSLPAGASVKDYFPDEADEKVQQFLINMPITTIPLDFNNYFDSTSLNTAISNTTVDNTITVPNINKTDSQTLSMSIVNDAINEGLSFGGSIPSDKGDITFHGARFESIEYTSGYMEISALGVPSGTTVTLYTQTDVSITSGTIDASGKATLNLTGKIIPGNPKIEFSAGVGLSYFGKIHTSSQIAEVKNFTMGTPGAPALSKTIDPITVPQGASGGYKECKIGTGTLKVSIGENTGWGGVIADFDLAFSGGLTLANVTPTNPTPTDTHINIYDLANSIITPVDITIVPTVKISFNNCNLDFSSDPDFKCELTVTNIASVTAKTPASFNAKIDKTGANAEALPADMLKFISSITFNESGLAGKYINSLPSGNDINIKIKSDFLGLSDGAGGNKIETLNAAGAATEQDVRITNLTPSPSGRKIKICETPSAADEFNAVDFYATIELPNYDPVRQEFTITGVAPNGSYRLYINLDSVLDWEQITIRKTPQTKQESTGMNLATMFSSFDEKLNGNKAGESLVGKYTIDELPIYLYFVSPDIDILNNAKFQGSLAAYYATLEDDPLNPGQKIAVKLPGSTSEVDMLRATHGDLNFSPMPTLKTSKLTSGSSTETVISNVSKQKYSATSNFSALASDPKAKNNAASSIFMDYSLSLVDNDAGSTELTVTKEAYTQATNGINEIAINAIIILPLKLSATDDIKLDVLGMMDNSGGDVFGRTSAPDLGETEKYFNAIEEVDIFYTMKKQPFYSDKKIKMNIDLGPGTDPYNFELGEGKINIYGDTMLTMLNTYPCSPKVYLQIEKNSVFSMPRKMEVSAKFDLSVKLSGEEIQIK